jgi:hypothetical protein
MTLDHMVPGSLPLPLNYTHLKAEKEGAAMNRQEEKKEDSPLAFRVLSTRDSQAELPNSEAYSSKP